MATQVVAGNWIYPSTSLFPGPDLYSTTPILILGGTANASGSQIFTGTLALSGLALAVGSYYTAPPIVSIVVVRPQTFGSDIQVVAPRVPSNDTVRAGA